jgi:TRAP-type C4-dicarboxylate transport system permease small subunit
MIYAVFEKNVNWLARLLGYLGALAVLASTVILSYEVALRYLFNRPSIWEIEASVFLLIFAGFIGAAFGLQKNAHISIDLITNRLGERSRLLLSIVTSIFCLLFCMAIVYKAWPMWWEAYDLDWYSESLWGPPLWIPYLFLPIGFSVLCLQYVVEIVRLIQSYRSTIKQPSLSKGND